jgi:hypothetical protein
MDPSLSKVTSDWVRAQPCSSDFVPNVIAVLARMEPIRKRCSPKGSSSAKIPVDILRSNSFLQDEIDVRGGNQGAASLEEKRV